MARPIELIPLVCVRCSARLPAQPDEVAWVCMQCGQGQKVDDHNGLTALDMQFASGLNPNGKGKPFWVVEGQVRLQRQTYSGNQDSEAQKFWGSIRQFFIPAYSLPLEQLLNLGRECLLRSPALHAEISVGPRGSFEPVTLAQEDVPALVEFIVMALEADRKDKLKELRLTLELQIPSLWILP